MAARRLRTDRLIAVLGAAVLLLGAVVGWRLIATEGVAPWETPPQRRALQQVRERFGPTGQVRLIERGRGPVVCGYVGRRGEAGTVAFVSRPNRILFADDPLVGEFRAMVDVDCPGLPTPPPARGRAVTEAPTAGSFEGREHRLPVRVYYEDTDFTGLVYHGSYVRFFERGRSDFLRAAGVGHAELMDGPSPLAFVVAEMSLRWLKPARIDDALIVRTLYERIQGPRLIIDQRITRGDGTLCEAKVTAVCIHPDGRPRRPTTLLMEKVRPWLAPAQADHK